MRALLLASVVVVLSCLMWVVFEPAIVKADVFYEGAGLDLLKLYAAAVACVGVLAALAYVVNGRQKEVRKNV